MKYFLISLFFIFVSCISNTPVVDYSFPHIGSSNNASIVVKNYETLGIIFVKSTEVIDGNGNHTGSKITYEMLMLEAQELGADDVINIRIDVNQKEDFAFGGELIKTTFNYTATALAIKYTTALAVLEGNIGNNPQNIGNNNIVVNQMKRSSVSSTSGKSANIRDNWISVGATMAGAGLKYERMLNPKWSLVADASYQTFGIGTMLEFGVGVTARFYPFGNVFYIGTGLGIYGYEYEYREEYYVNSGYWDYNYDYTVGFAITPELGVKIGLGRQGGFFMDIGAKGPQIFGGGWGYWFSVVPYVGFGGAF